MLVLQGLILALLKSCARAALTYNGCYDTHFVGYNPFRSAYAFGGGSSTVGARIFPIATGGRMSLFWGGFGTVTESPRSCLNKCKNLGYDFTGVENVNVVGTDNICLCGDSNQLQTAQPEPNGCLTFCPDRINRCGQTLGINDIYALSEMSVYSDPDIPKRTATALGCFNFPETDPPLASRNVGGNPDPFAKAPSPAFCLGHCYDLGYNFAGLNNGGQCWCGTQAQLTSAGTSTECFLRCRSGIDLCGGGTRQGLGPAPMSVYQNTDQSPMSLEMLGCYDSRPRFDAPRTLKVQIPAIPRQQETPERCVRTCNNHGFTHAGLEFGTRCFCGSPSDIESSRYINMDNCPVECQGLNGAARSCGGGGAMTVYRNINYTALVLNEDGCAVRSDIDVLIPLNFIGASPLNVVIGAFQTPESCVNTCTYNGYDYAAVQYRRCTCLTGPQLAVLRMQGVTQCVKHCLGKTAADTYKFCGADLTEANNILASIYSLNAQSPAPPPP